MLNDEEKKELKELAKSAELQDDMRLLGKTRYSPFIINGRLDLDRVLIFLTEYNHFINHTAKSFRKIIDNDMRL